VNKAGSNAVYVVLAVAFILTGSANATPVRLATALAARTATQPSITFDDENENLNGTLHCGAVLIVFGSSQCSVPGPTAIPLGTNVLRAPLTVHFYSPSGQDAKYRFAYLKRDPVYVRSKS
jgi:hypothetical protein